MSKKSHGKNMQMNFFNNFYIISTVYKLSRYLPIGNSKICVNLNSKFENKLIPIFALTTKSF